MATGDRDMAALAEQVRAELDALIGEPIIAFGSFAEPGFIFSGTRRGGVPGTTVWRSLANRFRRGRGDTLPLQLYLALTASRIVAVSMETSWRSRRAGFPIEIVRSWDRASTRAEVAATPDGPEVRLTSPDGEARLHSADLGRGFNDPILAALRS